MTIAWASEMGPVEWRDVGHDADKAARAKETSYEEALARETNLSAQIAGLAERGAINNPAEVAKL